MITNITDNHTTQKVTLEVIHLKEYGMFNIGHEFIDLIDRFEKAIKIGRYKLLSRVG